MDKVTLWSARLIDSAIELVFESAEGKVVTVYFTGVSESILSFINDDNNRKRIRKALEESYKYDFTEDFKIVY